MSAHGTIGPAVAVDSVEFTLADPALRGVALLHDLRDGPRRVEFERRGRTWQLTFPRPDADRFEYLLELVYRTGRRTYGPDPANPLRAPGPFGEKSVIEFPGYERPEWVDDEDAARGSLQVLELESLRLHGTLPALLWSAADTDPGGRYRCSLSTTARNMRITRRSSACSTTSWTSAKCRSVAQHSCPRPAIATSRIRRRRATRTLSRPRSCRQ